MARSKVLAWTFAAGLTAAASIGLHANACAEVVDLECRGSAFNVFPYNENLSVDLDANTVLEWKRGHPRSMATPSPAEISDQRVKFIAGEHGDSYVLDRTSGDLTVDLPSVGSRRVFYCRVQSKHMAPLF